MLPDAEGMLDLRPNFYDSLIHCKNGSVFFLLYKVKNRVNIVKMSSNMHKVLCHSDCKAWLLY